MAQFDSWTCLMVRNGPGMITDQVRAALKMAACELHEKKRDMALIKSDACEGILKTSWQTQAVGTCSGVLFQSEIESANGTYQVNFLLNTEDLERGAKIIREMEERGEYIWADGPGEIPCPALYQFYNLRPSRRLN